MSTGSTPATRGSTPEPRPCASRVPTTRRSPAPRVRRRARSARAAWPPSSPRRARRPPPASPPSSRVAPPAFFAPALGAATLLLPGGDPLARRKHWIAYTLKPAGTLHLDDGAERAL